MHSYAYLARKAFHAFIPRLSTVIFENAFVIQVRELQLPSILKQRGIVCLRFMLSHGLLFALHSMRMTCCVCCAGE